MPLSARFPGRDQRDVAFPHYGLVHRLARADGFPSRPVDAFDARSCERRCDVSWGVDPVDRRDRAWPRCGVDSPSDDVTTQRTCNQKPGGRAHPYYYDAPPSHRVFLRDVREKSTYASSREPAFAHPRYAGSTTPPFTSSEREDTRLSRFASRGYATLKRRPVSPEKPSTSSRKRSGYEDSFNESNCCEPREQAAQDTDVPNEIAKTDPPSHTSTETTKPKQSRYLREMDRRIILSRLAAGEKQSVLAKEYNVSRSTICNLFRQRDVVLARQNENPMARHPKKSRKRPAASPMEGHTGLSQPTSALRQLMTPETTSENDLDQVVHVQSRAISLLKQNLQDRCTPPDEFKRCCSRLMRLLVEESLAVIASRPCQDSAASWPPGRALDERVCAFSMEETGRAMLDTFRQLEPYAPSGMLSAPARGVSNLPLDLTALDVLLLDVVAVSERALCTAIDELLARGAQEERVSLVALFVSSEVVSQVQLRYPGVQILTTTIDKDGSSKTPSTSEASAFLDRFQSSAWGGSQVLWSVC